MRAGNQPNPVARVSPILPVVIRHTRSLPSRRVQPGALFLTLRTAFVVAAGATARVSATAATVTRGQTTKQRWVGPSDRRAAL